MEVACPNCSTRYNVPDDALTGAGQRLKCAVCSHMWTATAQDVFADVDDPLQSTSGFDAPFNENEGDPSAESSEFDFAAASSKAPSPDTPAFESAIDDVDAVDPDDDLSFEDTPPPFITEETLETAGPTAHNRKITIKRKKKDRRPLIAAALAVLAVTLGSIISYRDAIVSVYPQSASAFSMIGLTVNLRGLVFSEITMERALENGVDVINIKGNVVNIEDAPTPLPTLRFSMRDSRNEEIYSWQSGLTQEFARPGETLPFESQVITPPPQGHSIKIFFVDGPPPLADAGSSRTGS